MIINFLRIISIFILLPELLSLLWWMGTVSHSQSDHWYYFLLLLALFFFSVMSSKFIETKIGLLFALMLLSVPSVFSVLRIQSGKRTLETIAGLTWAEIFLGVAWFIYILIVMVRKRNTTAIK